jgi:hypothetical protein
MKHTQEHLCKAVLVLFFALELSHRLFPTIISDPRLVAQFVKRLPSCLSGSTW